jgi:predicted NUDIX family phosphoesterase
MDSCAKQLDEALDAILDGHFFLDRPTAEVSPQYKQIIPYVVIRHDGSFFLLQRTQKQTEARLHLSSPSASEVTSTGHAPDLLARPDPWIDEGTGGRGPRRGDYDLTFVGILNDDTTEVGSVHLGAVYVLDAHDANVTVRETDKMTGRWAAHSSLRRCASGWRRGPDCLRQSHRE